MAQPGDHRIDLEPGELAALARLGALRDLDLDLAAVVEIFGGDAEARRGDLLDRRRGIVAIGARLRARRILAALAAVGFGADAVHRDGEILMRLGPERAERNPGRDQALANFGDRFDLVGRDGSTLRLQFEQVAQRDRRQCAQALAVALEGGVGIGGDRLLQRVDEPAREGMLLAIGPHPVEASDRQRRVLLGEGAAMQTQRLLLDAGEADAGDARGHARKELGHQSARQPDRLEIIGAAI